MSEKFNIEKIENFINTTNILDNSHIGSIIKKILEHKSQNNVVTTKNTIPYSIEDKIDLNNMTPTLGSLIISSWSLHFSTIDFTINTMAGVSSSIIIEEVFEFYKLKYVESLLELKIDVSDEPTIKKKSTDLFMKINVKVKEIFTGKETDFSVEQLDIYVFAITVYVFYKCKILIPIKEG